MYRWEGCPHHRAFGFAGTALCKICRANVMSPWLVKLVLLEILLQFQIWKLALNLELFYLMRNMEENMEKFTSAGLSSNILFRGVNCHKKEEEKKKRKYIYIGAMQVDIDD